MPLATHRSETLAETYETGKSVELSWTVMTSDARKTLLRLEPELPWQK